MRALTLLAPLLLLTASPAGAADPLSTRSLTVKRTPLLGANCALVPVITGPGLRHMGEPGTYVARWDWGVPPICRIRFLR